MPRAALALALLSSLVGCSSSWSPAQIDDVASTCRARIADGSIVPKQSLRIGIPAHTAPAREPVVIYGAAWCSACALTKAYLEERHIPFVDRDIEEDPSALAARDAALAAAGLGPTTSLPVVDVRGTVTIGFFPCVIEKAWYAETAQN